MGDRDKLGVGGTHIGRALVESARGLLMHEIALDDERVADHVIVAPTELPSARPPGRSGRCRA